MKYKKGTKFTMIDNTGSGIIKESGFMKWDQKNEVDLSQDIELSKGTLFRDNFWGFLQVIETRSNTFTAETLTYEEFTKRFNEKHYKEV